jgi:AraC family transcriptional regulator of arabinose operon
MAGNQKNDASHDFIRPANFPYWTLIFIRKGDAPIRVGDEALLIAAPYLMLVRPGAAYKIGDENHPRRWSESWMFFAPLDRWDAWMNWPVILPGIMGLAPQDRGLTAAMTRACDEAVAALTSALAIRNELGMNHLERLLILAQLASNRGPGTRLDARIQAVIDYLNLHLNQPLSVGELADAAHISESHLAHLFREQVGVPPKRFIEMRRMQRAMDLLISTNRPIGQIANDVGFDNAFHFSARFRRCAGCSPRKLRQNPTRRSDCYAHLIRATGLQEKK